MNRLALAQEVVRLCGIADTGPDSTISQTGAFLKVVQYIDIAYQEIQSRYFDWDFLWATTTLTTEADTADYDGADDLHVWDVERIFYGTTRLEVEWWDSQDNQTATTGAPSHAVLRPDNKLRLVPTPDDAYTITYDYFKKPDVMSADDDDPIIPEQYHYVIVGRALILFGNYEDAPEVKMQGQELYMSNMRLLENHQLQKRQQTYARFEGVDVRVVAQ